VSVVFLYVGLIPDLAAVRERMTGWRRRVYRILSLGWRGTQEEWRHYRSAYLLLAALATPLVVSVHSVVSWDFAMALVPGWHSTIFAPYFVAGAIFSGLAMVLTLTIPLRRLLGLEAYITDRHLERVAQLLVVTSLVVTYAYACEFFMAWYSGNAFEQAVFRERAFGTYAPLFWPMVFCNSVLPLTLLVRRIRTDVRALWVVALLVNVGMWLERFVIITGSLSFDYEPWYWADAIYRPRWVEYGITAGSFAWFLLWFFLFVKHFPVLPMAEVREALAHENSIRGQVT
jgi:molybdopterin-containing oxidoreductase family membrane subunit